MKDKSAVAIGRRVCCNASDYGLYYVVGKAVKSMLKIREKASDEEVLERVKQLPENMKIEMLDFLDFLIQKSRKRERPQDVKMAVSAVEDTWGSISLNREVLKFVAEDKELEYEV